MGTTRPWPFAITSTLNIIDATTMVAKTKISDAAVILSVGETVVRDGRLLVIGFSKFHNLINVPIYSRTMGDN